MCLAATIKLYSNDAATLLFYFIATFILFYCICTPYQRRVVWNLCSFCTGPKCYESSMDNSRVVRLMLLYVGSVQWHQPEVSDSDESLQCKKMAQPPQPVHNCLLTLLTCRYILPILSWHSLQTFTVNVCCCDCTAWTALKIDCLYRHELRSVWMMLSTSCVTTPRPYSSCHTALEPSLPLLQPASLQSVYFLLAWSVFYRTDVLPMTLIFDMLVKSGLLVVSDITTCRCCIFMPAPCSHMSYKNMSLSISSGWFCFVHTYQEIGWKEHLQSDLVFVEWDVKPYLRFLCAIYCLLCWFRIYYCFRRRRRHFRGRQRLVWKTRRQILLLLAVTAIPSSPRSTHQSVHSTLPFIYDYLCFLWLFWCLSGHMSNNANHKHCLTALRLTSVEIRCSISVSKAKKT